MGVHKMNATHHRFSELFLQLGLPADIESIEAFLTSHSPLDSAIKLEEAPFWTEAQANFLRDEILQDADWAEVVDQLNSALRSQQEN